MYDPKTFTFGTELEVGDVDRYLVIPREYGEWEYAETDIVNILPPYQHICSDPRGEDPPVGGEINTKPTASWKSQVELIRNLFDWLKNNNQTPTTNCISHTHIHIHVPNLIDDIDGLKRLTKYIAVNQNDVLKYCHQFDEKRLKGSKIGRTYLKWDCGRPMPEYMSNNIDLHAKTFADYIRLHRCGKSIKTTGRPFRFAINTYCLKHIKTVEFRLFRGSVDIDEIASCLFFVKKFMAAALNDGPSVKEIITKYQFKFPPFRYSLDEVVGWQKTKYGKERGIKNRKYIEV